MKKMISLLCALALLVGVMCVGGVGTASAMTSDEKKFERVLDMFYFAITSDWSDYTYSMGDEPYTMSYMYPYYYKDYSLSEIGYTLKDVNKDGQKELIVSPIDTANRGNILDMYTIVNGSIVHLFDSGERYMYSLATDNSLVFYGSSGAGSSVDANFTVTSDGRLKVKKAVIYEYNANPNKPYFYATSGYVYPAPVGSDYGPQTNISTSYAQSIINSFPKKTAIRLTPFSQYDPYSAVEYKVTFNANGGSGAPSAQTKVTGTPLTLSSAIPTRSGYAFLGWSTSPSATTAAYQPGGQFKNNANTTLYAVWQKGAYRVSFNANGGRNAPAGQIKVPGTPLTLSSAIPTRSGYAFLGWATSASAASAVYQPGDQFKNNANTTLYAVWQQGVYRVSFNANGGKNAPAAQIKVPGTPLTLAAQKPTRSGYAFLGWATSPSATTVAYQPGSQFKNNTHTTLYAVWQQGVYRVDYMSHSGSNVPSPQIKVPGTPLTISYNIPKRSGYAFYGWSTSASSSTVAYQPGDQFKNNTHTTLHAVWLQGAHRVTFHPNGGKNAPAAQFKIPGTPLTLASAVPTRSGYAFVGWATSASATTATYQPGDQFKNNVSTTLYAVWQEGAYRVSFNANGGKNAPGGQIKVPGTALKLSSILPTRSGYAFVGWSTNKSATTAAYQPGDAFKNNANTTLYAVWKQGVHRVGYHANGGSGAPAPQFKVPGTPLTLTSQTPTRAGYTFLGWATNKGATTAAYQPGDQFKNNTTTTFYAVWRKTVPSLTVDGTHTANITTGGQEVFFIFKPTTSGQYRIYSTGSSDTQVYLYDASGNQLAYDDDDGEGRNFLLTYTLTAGVTYQYGVCYYSSSSTGTITFRFEKVGLTPGQSYTANITTGGGQAEYTFIPSTSGTYRIYSTGSGDTRVYLYDANGNQLDSDDDSGDSYNFSLDYTMTAGTTYKYVIRFYGSSSTGSIPFYFQKV